ncbi:MAG: binding methyltransferase FtsJ like protein [Labilithrix sp.]|nr:binding methyltransferase FtsJ like protein [Labilithrix sp.]
MKVRADQLLVARGLAPSRPRAQALVLAGKVYVGETRIDKAGALVQDDAEIVVRGGDHAYVSRGGVKLEGALDAFGVDPAGKRCLDLGASTGGFTDCLLQRGAVSVAAVDVGYGQLAHKLRTDPRVLVLERTNARTLEPEQVGGKADLVVVDASFIGLGKLADAIVRCLAPGGELVALVKPQFEVGREAASKTRGVVRDPALRARAIESATNDVAAAGLVVLGTCDSTLEGPKGNLEAFLHARLSARDGNGDIE